MMEEYEKHVARGDNSGMTWCGVLLPMDFVFVDSEHAALNGRNEGRLVACRECTENIVSALNNGFDGSEAK